MENKTKITETLQKLLALSKSSNQHEAELAMSKANELMEKYQITMSEVLVNDLKGQRAVRGNTIRVSETYRSFIDMIAAAAATLCDACALKVSAQASVLFIGAKEDVANAEIMFWYLFNSWKSIVQADCSEFQAQYSFVHGINASQYEVKKYKIGHGQGFSVVVLRRAERLAEERKEAVQQSSATGNALVVLKNQIIEDYIKDIPTAKTRYKQQDTGFGVGAFRGQHISLNGAIENGT